MAAKSTKPAYEVRLKPGHPTGVYRRAGIEFAASAPTILGLEQMKDAIKKDTWLIVTETEIEITPARKSKDAD